MNPKSPIHAEPRQFQASQLSIAFDDIKIYNIVSYGLPTIGRVKLGLLLDKPKYNLYGDGTVPLKSAETINETINDDMNFYFQGIKHSAIPSNEEVLDLITDLLQSSEYINSDYNLPNNYSYAVDELEQIDVSCPVIVHAYDSEGNHTGPTSDSTYVEEIHGSSYMPADLTNPDSRKTFLLPSNINYNLKIESQDTSSYFDVSINKFTDGEIGITVEFDSILTLPNTVAYMEVDSLSSELSIDVDIDGNGSVDSTYSPTSFTTGINKFVNKHYASQFQIFQNYPNPFNPVTTLSFALPIPGKVKIDIFDIRGQKIETIVNRNFRSGMHNANFDGSGLATGIYFYKIKAGNFTQVKKMVLIK